VVIANSIPNKLRNPPVIIVRACINRCIQGSYRASQVTGRVVLTPCAILTCQYGTNKPLISVSHFTYFCKGGRPKTNVSTMMVASSRPQMDETLSSCMRYFRKHCAPLSIAPSRCDYAHDSVFLPISPALIGLCAVPVMGTAVVLTGGERVHPSRSRTVVRGKNISTGRDGRHGATVECRYFPSPF
jgi:hypothetical protein